MLYVEGINYATTMKHAVGGTSELRYAESMVFYGDFVADPMQLIAPKFTSILNLCTINFFCKELYLKCVDWRKISCSPEDPVEADCRKAETLS